MKLKVVNGLLVVESFENLVQRDANRSKKAGPKIRLKAKDILNLELVDELSASAIEVEKEEGLEEPSPEVKEKEVKLKPKEKKNDRDGNGTITKTTSDSS